MLPTAIQSFIAYSVVEYATEMGLIDNGIRIFLYDVDMSQDAKLRLMALEVVTIGLFGLSMLIMCHHIPVISILMIWSCLASTKHLWQVLLRRYWNDFLEFEHFKPRQLFVHQMAPMPSAPGGMPTSRPLPMPAQTTVPPPALVPGPGPDKERFMRNGGVDDSKITRQIPHTPLHGQIPVNHQMQYAQQRQPPPASPPPPHLGHNWRQSLQSAMSSLRKVKKRPPGLENDAKQNLCSINVVLQSLASTPMLATNLIREHPRVKKSPVIQDFIKELGELLLELKQCDKTTLSAERLVNLASALGPPQPQNDCVEWLMWLLEVIQSAYIPPAPSEVESGLQRFKLLRAVPLAQPLLILYDPSQLPSALARMKSECLDKIDHAHALQSASYAEPIQRLTEVEWLNHKLSNHSVIDDMLTGQVVEAQHCKVCHHLSASVQPFKVLSLPIVPLVSHSDHCVTLQDCISKYTAIERLYGANGLLCKQCNRQRPVQSYTVDPSVKQQVFKRNVLDSGVGGDSPLYNRPHPADLSTDFLSPIRPYMDDHLDNSAFQDVQTSTPVNNRQQQHGGQGLWQNTNFHSPLFSHPRATSSPLQKNHHLSDGERQALICQLPDFFIIQLLRQTYRDGRMMKVETPVSIPVNGLDLSHHVTENLLGGDHKSSINGCYKYCLYAMVVHVGENSVTRGHYLSYTLTDNGSWYCCNDSKVTPVNMDYEVQTRHVRENAYLLWYRKVRLV